MVVQSVVHGFDNRAVEDVLRSAPGRYLGIALVPLDIPSSELARLAALGFRPFLAPEVQAPIIVTFHAPAHAAYDFKRFYASAKARGFLLYPGKLTQLETFRVGCIGAIGRNEMQQAVHAVADTLREMGIASGAPAL